MLVLPLVGLIYGFFSLETRITSQTSDLLAQSAWTETDFWKDEDGDGVFIYDTDSCQADNNWRFNADSALVITEGVLKCEEDMPYLDTIYFNWLLKNNETVLSMISKESDLDFQIFAIGEHELILYLIDPENTAAPTREKIILRR
ncbi:MAG: hypothetical protein IPK76_06700 [Lewinellaceae bacterium]|nr:hypothetical protein [Lewinellaceae bacterium]